MSSRYDTLYFHRAASLLMAKLSCFHKATYAKEGSLFYRVDEEFKLAFTE
jgi:hypothetical protein